MIYLGGELSRELLLDTEDLKLGRLATGRDDEERGVAANGILSSFSSLSVDGGGGYCVKKQINIGDGNARGERLVC